MLIKKDKVVFTGGIGDIITIDSFFTNEDRQKIKKIYWATKTHHLSQQLFIKESYPNLKKHIVAWNQFDLFPSFGEANWINKFTTPPPGYNQAQDLSIANIFKTIIDNNIPFQGSCLLKNPLTNIKKFKLPKEYICITPGTDNHDGVRNFTQYELINLDKWLIHTNQLGVIIGTIPIPVCQNIIDLTNKTTMLESVEILKNAYGYIGVDSWLTVLATQLFDTNRLVIKSNNMHLFLYKTIYYGSQKSFDFIIRKIESLNPDPLLASYPFVNISENLHWCYLHDVYYHPNSLNLINYDKSYFEKYKSYEKNEISDKLINFRTNLVNKYCKNAVLDIGIGSGLFIRSRKAKTYGFDICQEAIDWLKSKNLYTNPWIKVKNDIQGYCFWDSLEHIAHPSLLLSQIPKDKYVFVTIPILPKRFNFNNIHQWKHFRPNEHIHYWTENGFINFMETLKFSLVKKFTNESDLGREDIKTYVLRRT